MSADREFAADSSLTREDGDHPETRTNAEIDAEILRRVEELDLKSRFIEEGRTWVALDENGDVVERSS